MRAVLEGLLIAGLVVGGLCVLAAAWVWHGSGVVCASHLVCLPGPDLRIVSPTAPARLHRRLCTVAASPRLASTLDPGVAPLADDLVAAEAHQIEPPVIAVARTRRAGWSVRRDLSTRVSELKVVARRLATLSSEPTSPAEPSGPTRLLERLSALEEARQELAEIELRAGLLKHT